MKHQREDSVTLEILEAIDTRSDVTQRSLALQLGVALGLTNSYLRRCVRKGLVKIQHAPANRYLYYLTPKGFAEKSRLTAQYLVSSFDYYHRAGAAMATCYTSMVARGYRHILFAGMSELTEIASVRAHDFGVELVGTIDPSTEVDSFLGLPVWRRLGSANYYDAILFTALSNPRDLFKQLQGSTDVDRIFIPAVLKALLEPDNRFI